MPTGSCRNDRRSIQELRRPRWHLDGADRCRKAHENAARVPTLQQTARLLAAALEAVGL